MTAKQIGEYVIGQKLGEGSFCVTYRGQRAGGEVILKRIKPELVSVAKIGERVRAQAISPPRVEHPLVAGLITIVLDADGYWLVREAASGEPLDVYCRKGNGRKLESVLPAFCKLLDAFHAAHKRGFFHGNLKPSNLWAESDGRFRVTDFEMARIVGVSGQTREWLGTPETRSPEHKEGDEIDARSDVYSLGAALRQIVKGQPGGSAELRAVLDRATAREREQRYRSAAEFREALAQCIPAAAPAPIAPVVASSLPPVELTRPAAEPAGRRMPWGMAGAAAAAVVLGWGLWRTTGSEKTAAAKSITPDPSPVSAPVNEKPAAAAALVKTAAATKPIEKPAPAAEQTNSAPPPAQTAQTAAPEPPAPKQEPPRQFVWNQKPVAGPSGSPGLPAGDPVVNLANHAAVPPPVPTEEVRVSAPPPNPAQAAQEAPVRMSGKAVGARLVRGGSPTYPPLARQMRISGAVRLEIQIDERGAVSTVRPLTGHPVLAAAAVDAARKWTYAPATLDGKPIASTTQVDISFMSR